MSRRYSFSFLLLAALVAILLRFPALNQAAPASTVLPASPALQPVVDAAVAKTLEQFAGKGVKSNHLAVTLVNLKDAKRPARASNQDSFLCFL